MGCYIYLFLPTHPPTAGQLSLYFLLWVEGANLRHMSETLWLLYWVLLHCPPFIGHCLETQVSTSLLVQVALRGQAPAIFSCASASHFMSVQFFLSCVHPWVHTSAICVSSSPEDTHAPNCHVLPGA